MSRAKDIINRLTETGPVGKEGALKFVFKLPKEGKFTADFLAIIFNSLAVPLLQIKI